MTERRQELLSRLGFRFGMNGPHAARTMMLDDLRTLLASTGPEATRADYSVEVIDRNGLGKPTRKARELAFKHLASLYALEPSNPMFRALRQLWPRNEAAQPMLALAVALARDPLLRSTQPCIMAQPIGTPMPRSMMEDCINANFPKRFSVASVKSFAQNVQGTWTAAGLLQGRKRKTRALPASHPESAAMLLFLGYLEGRTGQRLFSSEWLGVLGVSQSELEALASKAAERDLLDFLNAGGVKELRFKGYLSAEEEQIRQEISHVV